MSILELEKIVIVGWDNFTASLAEGIKKKFSQCEVICVDPLTPEIKQALEFGYLDPTPSQKMDIYENAQFVIINQTLEKTLVSIEEIKSLIDDDTYIMDFQAVKSDYFSKASRLLETNCISCFVFLDDLPQNFTVRGDLFKDKIVAVISDTSNGVLQKIRDFWNIFGSKIVPTSADFFDEILSETTQSVSLISHMFSHVLLQDSWVDTLFFGFYNKNLRSFLEPASVNSECNAENIINNADNVRRTLSFIKRELDKIDQMIDEEDTFKLSQYLNASYQFKKRL